jgi:hypothetical protein
MKMPLLAAALIAFAAPAAAQQSPAQSSPPSGMPMGQMMGGQGKMGQGMMGQGRGMMGGGGRGMMGRFSPEDMNAFIDAHIAAIHAGLKLSAEQETLWPPVEDAMRNLARLRASAMQGMRQSRGMMAGDPVGFLRTMADRMGQGSEALRKLADAAAPLYASLDDAQKQRLHVLVRMGGRGMMSGGMMGRGMMGRGMYGAGRGMMQGGYDDDDDDDSSR